MPGLRDIRDQLLLAYDSDEIDDAEFLLLLELNTSKNLDYPYWTYGRFNLEALDDSECWTEFRFYKSDICRLKEALQIPDVIKTYNRLSVDGVEALCILLNRFSYPCRYSSMIPRFGRPVPQYSIISNHLLKDLYERYHHLLENFNQRFLEADMLEMYCQAIHDNGAALSNCFGFVDGTVRPISRPGGQLQRHVYNGHKRVHALKFQNVVVPNGLIANMWGPMEGRRHDSRMLALSGLLPKLQAHALDRNGNLLCIYGDPAYPLGVHLQAPFRNAQTQQQQDYNKSMSQVRIAVEWLFNDIVNWFSFLDFKKSQKMRLSSVGKMYIVCALFTNARTCMYGNSTSKYFDCLPPTVEEYFI